MGHPGHAMPAAERLTGIDRARDEAVAVLLKIMNMDNAHYAPVAAWMFSDLVKDKTRAVLVLQRVVDRRAEGYAKRAFIGNC